jgi:hypothetical protein
MILEAELPRDARAAFRARALVADFRCGLTIPQLADAMLAVSELVARASRRGDNGRITLRLESPVRGLRAHVGHEENGFPPADGDIGLEVVRATTDDWGLEEGGTDAWFEIGVSPTRQSPNGTGRAGS